MAFGVPLRKVRLTADVPFLAGPLLYHGGLLRATAAGASIVDVYDALAVDAALLADAFRAAANEHDQHIFDAGLFMERGIFIDLGANVADFILYFDLDVEGAFMGPRAGP